MVNINGQKKKRKGVVNIGMKIVIARGKFVLIMVTKVILLAVEVGKAKKVLFI